MLSLYLVLTVRPKSHPTPWLCFSHIWLLSNYKLGTNHHVDDTRSYWISSVQQLALKWQHTEWGVYLVTLVVNQSCEVWSHAEHPGSSGRFPWPPQLLPISALRVRDTSLLIQGALSRRPVVLEQPGDHFPNVQISAHSPIPAPSWLGLAPVPQLLRRCGERRPVSPQVAETQPLFCALKALFRELHMIAGRWLHSGCAAHAHNAPGGWEGPPSQHAGSRYGRLLPPVPRQRSLDPRAWPGKMGRRRNLQHYSQAPGKSQPSCDAILPLLFPKVWNRPPPGSICFPILCAVKLSLFLLLS